MRPAGVGILVVGGLLLYYGLQFARGGGHSLASTVGFDLCGRLGPQPAAALPDLAATPAAPIPDFIAGRGVDREALIAFGDAVARRQREPKP